MEGPSTLGSKIRDLRLRMNLTQAQLAGSEFTKSFISQVEKGQTRPSLKSLEILARRLNQPVSYFLEDGTKKPAQSKVASLQEAASSAAARGEISVAVENFLSALEACDPADHITKGSIWHQLGQLHFRLRQFDKAEKYLSLACEELERISPTELYARAICDRGSVLYQMKQFQRARELYEKALLICKQTYLSNVQVQLTVMSNLANTLALLHEYNRALEILEEAIAVSRDQREYSKFGQLWHICGYVYDKLGKYQLALETTQRAIDFYGLVENTPLYLSCKVNKAIHLRKLRKFDEARSTASEVLREARKGHVPSEAARAHAELAHIALANGEYHQVVEGVTKAFTLAPEHDEIPEWLELLVRAGEARPLAREVVDDLAERVARWRGDRRALAEAHSSLGSLYQQLGDTVKANHHLSESVSLFKDSPIP